MSDQQKALVWRCPEGHEVSSSINGEDLLADLAKGEAGAFCLQCGQNYRFSPAAQEDIKRWLDAGSTEIDSAGDTCPLCGKTLTEDEGGDVPLSMLKDNDRATVIKNLNPDGTEQPGNPHDLLFVTLCEECFSRV